MPAPEMTFALIERKWYLMEHVSPSGERHHSPIWLRKTTSKQPDTKVVRIEFYHVNYAEGVRDKSYNLEVLHRDHGYLLAMRLDENQERVAAVILESATADRLARSMPDWAAAVTKGVPLDRALDLLTERVPTDVRPIVEDSSLVPDAVTLAGQIALAHAGLTVAGIDVGAPGKGFHAVALRGGRYLDKFASCDASQMTAWCREIGASVVGIDAPCRWSLTGGTRPAELALKAEGIGCFSTPSRSAAESHPTGHFDWMLAGAELFRQVETSYPLFVGERLADGAKCSCETFPHAVTCVMLGRVVAAKNKRRDRLGVLASAGITLPPRASIDVIDAAICALAALYLAGNSGKSYGDAESGLIVVPMRRR
jgi:predicted RNase H-like nuclease